MTDREPFWKGNVLYAWSDIYKLYIANYTLPIHQILLSGMSIDEWKEMTGLDKYKELEE